MADSKETGLPVLSVPSLDDIAYIVDVSDTTDDAAGSSKQCVLNRMLAIVNPAICQGRLTLESGVAVSLSDQTGKTNVYFTPYNGNRIGVYDGTRWKLYSFSELTLALGTLTSGKNYDVFVYDNSGTLTLEALVWTDDTTRATALTTQDGVYVKTGATTRRYLGTFRTTATTTTEDSAAKRFLWNAYNRIPRRLQVTDATATWTYNSDTIRQARATAGNKVEVVCGLAESALRLLVAAVCEGTGVGGLVAVGEDSTTAMAAEVVGAVYPAYTTAVDHIGSSSNCLEKTVPLGYHYYAWLEAVTNNGSTVTFFGDAPSALRRAGLLGTVQC